MALGGRWRMALIAGLGLSSALVAGCGTSTGTTATTTSATSTTVSSVTTAAAGATTTTSATRPAYEVGTGTVKGIGTVLVDGKGLTLYLFVPDKQLSKSTCYGACAQGWPPLLLPTGVTSPLAAPGVESSLLGTTQRTDGTTQVTYDKWPLYLWVGDSEPGQATGQGLNNLGGLWYVLSPDGHTITTKP